jgi:hypothetical protein
MMYDLEMVEFKNKIQTFDDPGPVSGLGVGPAVCQTISGRPDISLSGFDAGSFRKPVRF